MASVPLGVVLIIVAGMSGSVAERIGVKPVLLSGLAIFTVGVNWMPQISVHGSYLTDVFGPSLMTQSVGGRSGSPSSPRS